MLMLSSISHRAPMLDGYGRRRHRYLLVLSSVSTIALHTHSLCILSPFVGRSVLEGRLARFPGHHTARCQQPLRILVHCVVPPFSLDKAIG